MIDVKDVYKSYGKGKNLFVALNNINFQIPSGVSVAITGKSGSGKSTLMHVMSGLDRAGRGEIIVDNENILKLKPKAVDRFRAEKIGFIFQSFFVQGNETSYDNVGLPLEIARAPRASRRQKIEAALQAVDLVDKTRVKAKNLSGGQKQRLAIARAIVNQPSVIFADEPTGNLDSTTGQRVEKLLFDYSLKKGATLIIVTHDADLASKCDMQIFIKDGEIEKITSKKTSPKGRTNKPAPRATKGRKIQL